MDKHSPRKKNRCAGRVCDSSVLFRNWTVHLADVPSVLRLTNCGTWSENYPAGEKHITTETHFSSLHTQKIRHSI